MGVRLFGNSRTVQEVRPSRFRQIEKKREVFGLIELDDFTRLAANFGANTLNRGGPPRLQELYVALLDYPQIYWEARGSAELWANFLQLESMNLGPIPAMPEGLRAIPEPSSCAMALLAISLTGSMNRRCRLVGN